MPKTLATFENAWRIALRLSEDMQQDMAIVARTEPYQPFAVVAAASAPQSIVATIAAEEGLHYGIL